MGFWHTGYMEFHEPVGLDGFQFENRHHSDFRVSTAARPTAHSVTFANIASRATRYVDLFCFCREKSSVGRRFASHKRLKRMK